MLVLNRNVSETIHVDGPCVITVVRVKSNAIRLGIQAGPTVKILRGELVEKDQKEASDAESR